MQYRLQHIVPRMVLEQFTDHKGHVWTYEKKAGAPRHAAPQETGVVAHFYSFEREDGSMDTTLEQTLSQFEGEAKRPYDKLLNGEMVTGSDRYAFASFLGLMVVRTATYRRIAAKMFSLFAGNHLAATAMHSGAFKEMVRQLELRDGKKLEPEYTEHLRQSMKDLTGFELSVPKEFVLQTIAHGESYSKLFDQMKWSVVRPKNGYFITGDNPVYRAVDPSTRHPIYGDHGYLNKTVQVSFPLSPRMMLLMMWEQSSPRVTAIERQHVDGQNRNRAVGAEIYLYAHLSDRRIERLAVANKDNRPDVGGGTLGGTKSFGSFKVPRRRTKRT